MIAQDQFEKHGWYIGSGPIEGMCKATTRRLTGPGTRWDAGHAKATMALESMDRSNLWDRYGKLLRIGDINGYLDHGAHPSRMPMRVQYPICLIDRY
jgi:hypothetical protein